MEKGPGVKALLLSASSIQLNTPAKSVDNAVTIPFVSHGEAVSDIEALHSRQELVLDQVLPGVSQLSLHYCIKNEAESYVSVQRTMISDIVRQS